uniref:Uncharacterized protein n=1 Tax=Panagrolaimus sp. PS1159 TaxID=55785 RepID=A0AC35G1H2_9BILA
MAQLYHFLSKAIRDALQTKKTDKRSIGSNRNSFDDGGPAYLSRVSSHEYIEMKEFCPPHELSLDTPKIISQQTSTNSFKPGVVADTVTKQKVFSDAEVRASTNSFKPGVVADTVTKQKIFSDAEVRDINSAVNEFEYADFYWEDSILDYLHPEDENQVTVQKF